MGSIDIDRYVEFVAGLTWEATGQEAVMLARRSLLDWMGVTLAGLHEPSSQQLSRTLRGDAAEVGGSTSALLLGYASYASEFEQTHIPSIVHISTVAWPAVFQTIWSLKSIDPQEWLLAFIAAFEVTAHLGRQLGPPLYAKGWHPTPLFGALAAAAAVARCGGATSHSVSMAMGTASALIGGSQSTFGTRAVALGVGNAAHVGYVSGRLACGGFDGPREVAAGPGHALWNMLQPELPPISPFVARAPRELAWNAFKAYPSALFTHAAIECAARLRAELAGEPLAEMRVALSPEAIPRVDRPHWPSVEAARYSVQFNVDRAWRTGKVDPSTFESAEIEDRSDLPIVVRSDPGLPRFGARVTVTSQSGRSSEARVDAPAGFPERPLTDGDLRAKFLSCVEPLVGAPAGEEMAALILSDDVDALAAVPDRFRDWVKDANDCC